VSEKNQQPTPRRLKEARKKGQVARSAEVTNALVLLGLLVFLGFGAWIMVQHLMAMLREAITGNLNQLGHAGAIQALLAPHLPKLFLIPIVIMIVFSLAGDFIQVRGNLSFHPLIPDMDRINPASGFKRMFSMKNVVDLVLSLVKMVLTLAVAWLVFAGSLQEMVSVSERGANEILSTSGRIMLKLLIFGAGIQILGAVLDYVYQQFQFLKDMRMSIEELRREYKDNEGDPQIRGQRKALAHQDALMPVRTIESNKEAQNARG